MTLRQQAHSLIDMLPERDIRPVIQIMTRMLPQTNTADPQTPTPKMQAFLELQKLRKEAAGFGFSWQDREEAMNEKYGRMPWEEDSDQSAD